mgnify:CR=1 FL=1
MFDFLDFPPFGHDGSGGAIHLPRMLQRGDGAAAMLSIHEFVNATASLMFLINEPVSLGICRITNGSLLPCAS